MFHKLVIVREDENDRSGFLAYEDNEYGKVINHDPGPTAEELCAFMDQGAESCNAHEFVGTHRLLGSLLVRTLGREAATKVLTEIAIRGGLDEMSGVCSDTDSYRELGVGCSGSYWSGKFKERKPNENV